MRDHFMTTRDLKHPCFEDLLILSAIRREYAQEIRRDPRLEGKIAGYWGSVHRQKWPLRPKALRTLEQIVRKLEKSRQRTQAQLAQIQLLRAQGQIQKADHDITAKGSGQPQSMSVKEEQLVCRKDLGSSTE